MEEVTAVAAMALVMQENEEGEERAEAAEEGVVVMVEEAQGAVCLQVRQLRPPVPRLVRRINCLRLAARV